MDRIFVDVREPYEFQRDHVEGAINLPPTDILSGAKVLENFPKDTELVLYCLSGSRSNASMHYLKQLGYTNLVNGINKDQIRAKYGV
jgi:rhodanese-related sulfurtransferase